MFLNNKSIFTKIITIIAIALICLVITVTAALLFGSSKTEFFNLSELNISNVIPVIIIGGFISCVAVGMLVIFLAKDIFVKIKDYFLEKDNGGEKE